MKPMSSSSPQSPPKSSSRSSRSLAIIHLILFIPLSLIILSFVTQPVESSSVAGQETLIGIIGHNFIILGADTIASSSISLTSSNVDKIRVIVDPFPYDNVHNRGIKNEVEEKDLNQNYNDDRQQVVAVASAGDRADSERLIGSLIAHTSSMEYQNLGCDVKCIYHGDAYHDNENILSPAGLDAESVSHLARGMIASSLRSRGQLKTCLLIAGMTRCHQKSSSYSEHANDIINHNNINNSNHPKNSDNAKQQRQTNNLDTSYSKRLQQQVHAATEEYKLNDENVIGTSNGMKKETKMNNNAYYKKRTVLKPKLFWLDEYGSLQNVEYAAHGLASNFLLSILDRNYNSNLSKEEAIALINDCFQQLRKRFVINSPKPPCIKYIDANGCTTIQQ